MHSRNALAARSCSSSNLQHTGSFKVRGASNKILSLGSDLEATVVAASSGNHGAAVAYVLRELGDKGLIFVPTGASPAKVENIRHFGAEVVFFGEDSIETETHARGWARPRTAGLKRSLSILTMTAVIGSGLAMASAATAQQPANPAPVL